MTSPLDSPSDVPLPREFAPAELLPEESLRPYLAGCGRQVKIFRGCRLLNPGRIVIGDFSQIDEGVFVLGGAGVEIGRYVHLALGCSITGGGECQIGDFAGIGAGVRLITGTDDTSGNGLTNPTVPAEYRTVTRSRVRIGAHAMVFTGSIVLPGVTIGEGTVVAAGSLVHYDLEPWGIYAGKPLVRIGTRPSETILSLAKKLSALPLPSDGRGAG